MRRSQVATMMVVVGSLYVGMPSAGTAQDALISGLGDVDCVLVEVDVDTDLGGLVFSDQVQTAVELTLRTNGIEVGCEGIGSLTGRLRLNLLAIPLEEQITGIEGVAAYSLTSLIEFSRYFSGGPGLSVWAAPWYRYNMLVMGRNRVSDAADREARSLTEAFVNDVLAARQRERS